MGECVQAQVSFGHISVKCTFPQTGQMSDAVTP
jgi:hypothetical protein